MRFLMHILDCTLRDGGLGLEDLKNYDINKVFTEEQKKLIAKELTSAGIDIIELGSIEKSEIDKSQYAIYQNIEEISKNIPLGANSSNYAALFRGPDTPYDEIPVWQKSYCKKIRVIIRYSELKKSIDFCAHLSSKGYEVCIQPMVTLRYTNEEIEYMLNEANKMNAYAVYFVDSYGYMSFEDIDRLYKMYDSKLKHEINIGFHPHNNINMAAQNVYHLLESLADEKRNVIIDSTCLGMGQGAGNMQTEVLVHYLNEKNKNDIYKFDNILNSCDICSTLIENTLWGYSLETYLPAIYKVAYKFGIALRKKNNCSYSRIANILKNIPENMRYRYSKENYEQLLDINGLK